MCIIIMLHNTIHVHVHITCIGTLYIHVHVMYMYVTCTYVFDTCNLHKCTLSVPCVFVRTLLCRSRYIHLEQREGGKGKR